MVVTTMEGVGAIVTTMEAMVTTMEEVEATVMPTVAEEGMVAMGMATREGWSATEDMAGTR